MAIGEPARRLTRYVPRLAAEWEADAGDSPWRHLDATLCFIDISGFTNLAERLARFGRIGAEELTDVLNRIFGRMLDLAYLRGGTLLKFGGDALLLQFVGPDHPIQACSAAVELRAALREASQWSTSVGRLKLRMSVGVHSGEVHSFLVGGSHRELIITGPAATATTEMEHTADAGEIVVSSDTARLLPAGAVGKPKGEGWLLRWRQPPVPGAPPAHRRSVPSEVIASRIPVRLRNHLAAGTREPEHRIATVGFIHFSGVDAAIERDGPLAVASALDGLVRAVQDAADDEGVTFLASDLDSDGGKIIVTGGVPTSQEDDEGRVLRLLRRVLDHESPLAVRAGVNRGHVFASEVGSEHRATFTVMGDAVNLAARLMAAAPRGSLYATPNVLELSRTRFATTALEPFRVKGKAHPLQAYAVGDELGTRLDGADNQLPFTGRADEVAALRLVLSGEGDHVVTIVGDTGLGKSRLVEEALAETGARPFSVCGEQYTASAPYGALREPLRALFGVVRADRQAMSRVFRAGVEALDPSLRPFLPLLAEAANLDVEPTPEVDSIDLEFRRARLADLLEGLLAKAADGQLSIVVDDAHWIDEASVEVLDHLTSAIRRRAGVMIVARRPQDGGFTPPDSPTILLDPLAPGDGEALVVAATSAAPLRPHEVDRIVQRAGGNPLYLGEIVRFMQEVGAIEELPDSLDAIVSAKIDALPALTRQIVRYTAVLGRAFPRPIFDAFIELQDLSVDDATWRQLDEFVDVTVDEIRFRHALIRDAAYESLPYRRRRELHGLAAAAIQQVASANPEVAAPFLALHYSLSGDDIRAWHWARLAGDQAKQSYSNIEAARQFERALDVARRLEDILPADLVDLWTKLGDVRELAGLFDQAFDAFRRAFRIEHDPLARARLHQRRGRARERGGHYVAALRETTLGLRLLSQDESEGARATRANIMGLAAYVRQMQQRPREAIRLANGVLEIARTTKAELAQARALQVLDWADLSLGRPGPHRHSEQALAIYREIGDLRGQAIVLNNLGALAYFDGAWNEALSLYAQSRTAYMTIGNLVEAVSVAANSGEVLVNQGRLDEALPLLEEAARVQRASGFLDGAIFADVQLGRIHMLRNDIDRAERAFGEAWAEFNALGKRTSAFEAAIMMADCKLRRGDPAQALEMLDLAEAEGGEDVLLFQASMARVRAAALTALGRTDEAALAIASGIDSARQQEQPYDHAMLVITSADLVRLAGGQPDQTAVAEANEVLARLGAQLAVPHYFQVGSPAP